MDDRQQTHRNANDAVDPSAPGAQPAEEAFGEALLSAYLDGECTASEQAQIEEQISASSELRQLVDELRSAGMHLELLPQMRLEPDFAERVLRQAEREVLVGGSSANAGSANAGSAIGGSADGSAKDGAADADAVPQLPVGVSILPSEVERSGRARPFLWSLGALAAAVLILVTNREPVMRRDPVAKGPAAPQTAQRETGAAADHKFTAKSLAGNRPQTEAPADRNEAPASARPGSAPTKSSVDSRERDFAADSPAENTALSEREKIGLGASLREEKDATFKNTIEESTARSSTASETAADADTDLKNSLSPATIDRGGFGPSPGAQAPAAVARDLDESKVQLRTDAEPAATGKETPPMAPARSFSAAATTPPPADRSAAAAAAPALETSAPLADQPAQDNGVAAADDAVRQFTAPRESLRVVEVLVQRDAWQRKAVESVLAKNGIALYDSVPIATPLGPSAATPAPSQPVENNGRAKKDAKQPDAQATADGLELLVVSATSAQVEAALGDFGKQDEFQIVRVTDASGPAERFRESLQLRNNRDSIWSARGGQLPSATLDVPKDNLDTLGADDAAKANVRFTQPTDEDAAKKPELGIAPDDKKTAQRQYAKQGIAAPAEKASELRDEAAQTRRAKITAGAGVELQKDDARAPDGAADRAKLERGIAAQNAAGRSTAGGGGIGGGGAADAAGRNAASEGDAAGETAAGNPDAGSTARPFGGGGYGGLGGYGRGRGGAAGRARFAETSPGRPGYGGAGGGGFGGEMPADARATNLPTGYGQRLTLHQSAESYGRPNTPTFQYGVSPEGVRLQTDGAQAGSLAPEQVLFFFHVVDTPLAKSTVEGPKSNAASTSPVRGAGTEAARQGGRANAPVPAPAAPGNSPR